jgi:hypothetical protein
MENFKSNCEFQNSLHVEREVSSYAVTITNTEQTVGQVSDSIFAVSFPVLKGEIATKTVVV